MSTQKTTPGALDLAGGNKENAVRDNGSTNGGARQAGGAAGANTEHTAGDVKPVDVPGLPLSDIQSLPVHLMGFVTTDQVRAMGFRGWCTLSEAQQEALRPVREAMQKENAARNAQDATRRAEAVAQKRQAELDSVLGELGANTFEGATDWLVDGWFPVGHVSMVYGDSKTGKSTFMRALAAGIATESEVFPSFPRAFGRGIYLVSEDTGGRFLEGIEAQVEVTPLEEDEGFLWDSLKVVYSNRHFLRKKSGLEKRTETYQIDQGELDPEDVEDETWERTALMKRIGRALDLMGARFLIIDHVSKTFSNLPLTRDDDMRGPMGILCNFAQELGIALILIHHSLDTDKNWKNTRGMQGGTIMKQQSRSIVRVERSRGKSKVVHESNNNDEDEKSGKAPVFLEWVGGALREVVADTDKGEAAESPAEATDGPELGDLLVDWFTLNPEAGVTLAAIRQGRGRAAESLVAAIRQDHPLVRCGEVADAIEELIEVGDLALVETTINRKPKTVITLPCATAPLDCATKKPSSAVAQK